MVMKGAALAEPTVVQRAAACGRPLRPAAEAQVPARRLIAQHRTLPRNAPEPGYTVNLV